MPKKLQDALNSHNEKVEKNVKMGPLRKHILTMIHGVILSLQQSKNDSSDIDTQIIPKK